MILDWLKHNFIEFIASLLGIVSAYYAIKEKAVFWVIGIVSNVMFVIFFFEKRIYAIAILDTFYLGLCVWGLYKWIRKIPDTEKEKQLKIRNIQTKEMFFYIFLFVSIYVFVMLILRNFTASEVYYIDSLLFAFGVTGSLMLMNKIIENWYIWLVSDLVSITFFYTQKNFAVAVMYIFLLATSYIGLFQWKKKLHAHKI